MLSGHYIATDGRNNLLLLPLQFISVEFELALAETPLIFVIITLQQVIRVDKGVQLTKTKATNGNFLI